ncbi:MAG: trypsin-like peptidase domain-containing protein [Bryobacterales bacterium]|nr:trypsin-like peptidase domain-containing protein [Bryobacterales bacterium]
MSRTTQIAILLLAASGLTSQAMAASRITPPLLAEGGFADIVERTLPSVVRILVTLPGANGKSQSEGSGVVVSADGYLLTNRHVVDGASKILVQFHDDRELPAKVIASDGPTDMAVLKVDAAGLQSIEFANSDRVRIGEYALAVGNPFGVGTTVTLGIISAKAEGDYIQTDAAINPGNSGGPLLNTAGQMIGINTAIISPSGASSGVGLALPSNTARQVMSDLVVNGRVSRGYLGVGLQSMTDGLQQALGVTRGAALISDVAPDSPAAQAGLQRGDVVVAINGRVLRDFRRMQLYAAQARPHTTLQMTVAREGEETVIPVKLGEAPAPAASEVATSELLSGAVLAERDGLVVMDVNPEGASAQAGLQPGDVILAVNRKPVDGIEALRAQVTGTTDKPVLLEVSRGGATWFVAVPKGQ